MRLKARWRLARAAVKSFLFLLAGVVLVGFALLRTGLGHRTVLEFALGQARQRVAGDLQVGAIRSANLIRGARLVDVHLVTPDGRTLARVDSLEVSYDLLGLVRGDLLLDDVRLWGPDVRLVRRPGEEQGTLASWVGTRPGGAGRGPTVIVRDAHLSDAEILWSVPVSAADTDGLLRWEDTDEGLVRRIVLAGLDGELMDLTVGGSDAALSVQIRSLSATALALDEPLLLEAVDADALLRNDTLAVELEGGTVEGVRVRGPVSVVLGDPEGVIAFADVALSGVEVERLAWLLPPLPAASADVSVRGRSGPGGQRWTASELDARVGGGTVRGGGTVELDRGVRLSDVDLAFDDVALSTLETWVEGPLPLAPGRVSGRVELAGPPSELTTSGRLTFASEAYAPITAEFEGSLRLDDDAAPAVEDFRATIDPFDWAVVRDLVPGFPLEGPGRAVLRATGSWAAGLRFDADVTHAPADAPSSHLLATGIVRGMDDGSVSLDAQADLAPLSLDALRVTWPDLPLGGAIAGTVRARGLLGDMSVIAEVDTELGRLDLEGRADLRDLARGYRLEGEVTGFRASDVVPGLPDPSVLTGRVRLEGQGLTSSTLRADASVSLGPSSFGDLRVDSLRIDAVARDGLLTLDTLRGRAAGFEIDAGGTLALDTVQPAGRIDVRFLTNSLEGLRPLFMGDSVIARDALDPIERDLLELQGIDPDTLPTQAEVAMSGQARGEVALTGSLREFSAAGEVSIDQLRYGLSTLDDASLTFRADGLPELAGAMSAELDVGAAEVFDRTFSSGRLEVDYQRPRGRAALTLERDESEDYRARAEFELDSLGGTVQLEELALRFDTLSYALERTATFTWSDSALVVSDLGLASPGTDGLSLRAEGVLPRAGSADFTLEARRVSLARLVQIAQIEDLDLDGSADLDVRIEGTASSPTISGSFDVADVTLETVELSRLAGELDYADRTANVRVDAWRGGVPVLRVEGQVPIDLALRETEDRTPERPLALDVQADSLPAAFVLTLLEDLEDVRGEVTARLEVGGTLADPVAEGTIRLAEGAWTVGAIGVRQTGVDATLEIAADDQVRVRAQGRAGGTVEVTGTIAASPLSDPGLDLAISLNEFTAVDRRDVEGTVTGQVQLTGRFGQPVITGDLQVDEGILYLEEFQRAANVVNLSDPRFFAYIDTSLFSGRPLLADTRNPFMDNLRVNVNLDVEGNTWLRSPTMNVEIGGDLIVVYDRPTQDLVMIGQLEAIRGQYTFLGRTFEVRAGAVEFIGTPGINPNLDIQAVARVQTRGGEPLDITANLEGTLVDPRVSLTTDAGGVSESDLVSYLVFGRPSTEVNSIFAGGETAEALGGRGISFGLSTLATNLGALAQGWGLVDYLAITQSDVTSVGGTSPLSGTQIEFGQYLASDYFAAVTLRPLQSTGSSRGLLGGFRLEWQASDEYHVELFAEDRFLRSGGFGFRDLGLNSTLIYGVQLVREWGY